MVCIIQFILMLAVGINLFPLLGLPKLILGSNIMALSMVVISAAFAAIGYGIMIGSIFKTYQQATSFGSVSVIILAALGGVWVPVYLMPNLMRTISSFSPLNWGLNAFYNIFMRSASLGDVMTDCLKMLAFFVVCLAIGVGMFKIRKEK